MRTKAIDRIIIGYFILLVIAIILSACGPAAEEPSEPAEEPAAEEPAEEPPESIDPDPLEPVQYGQDSRTELLQHADPRLREMAASVGMFVHSEQVEISGDVVRLDGYTLNEMSEMGWLVPNTNAPICSGELFASQPAPGFCTGFLVEEDLIVTAGHCLQKVPCSDSSIMFDFYMESDNGTAAISSGNIYRCSEVIAQATPDQGNQSLDYAIIRLDRPTDRPTLGYVLEDQLETQTGVAVIGYPSGLPLKIASDAVVTSNETGEPFFTTNLDTFGSNSGSPVINMETYQVEGILVRGANDYVLSNDQTCVQVNRCPEGGNEICGGENATKMAMVAKLIPNNTGSVVSYCFSNISLILILAIMGFRK